MGEQIFMGEKYCYGLYYNTEEELMQFLGIEEYLNWMHGKHFCVSFDVEEEDENALLTDGWKLPDTLDMEIFDVRKYQDLTQVEMARKLESG